MPSRKMKGKTLLVQGKVLHRFHDMRHDLVVHVHAWLAARGDDAWDEVSRSHVRSGSLYRGWLMVAWEGQVLGREVAGGCHKEKKFGSRSDMLLA